jgi:hypothetical protein
MPIMGNARLGGVVVSRLAISCGGIVVENAQVGKSPDRPFLPNAAELNILAVPIASTVVVWYIHGIFHILKTLWHRRLVGTMTLKEL